MRSIDRIGTPRVAWLQLADALKIWIFDSLKLQGSTPSVIASLLGLTPAELEQVVYMSDIRQQHPASSQELWKHCISQSDGSDEYIDPAVLRQNIDYMSFAEQHEEVYESEIRLAVLYLRQRGVQGAMIQALIEDMDDGAWVQPAVPSCDVIHPKLLLNSAEHPSCLSRERFASEILANADLTSEYTLHHSHDLRATAPHFRSYYFPELDRWRLLEKDCTQATFIQNWFVYGQIPAINNDCTNSTSIMLQKLDNNILNVDHCTLQCMFVLLCRALRCSEFNLILRSSVNADTSLVCLWIYAVTRFVVMKDFIRKGIQDYQISSYDKEKILASADQEAIKQLKEDFSQRIATVSLQPTRSLPLPSHSHGTLEPTTDDTSAQSIPISSRTTTQVIDAERAVHPQTERLLFSSPPSAPASHLITPTLLIDENGRATISEHSSDLDSSGGRASKRVKRTDHFSMDATMPAVAGFTESHFKLV